MEKQLKSPINKDIKDLGKVTVGLNVLVHPVLYDKHKGEMKMPNVWDLKRTMEGKLALTKEDETKVLNMLLDSHDHPWLGVVVSTNKIMEETHGLKVGSIIDCGRGLVESRSFIKDDGIVYPMITLHQIFAIEGHVKLEKKEIKIFKL